MIDSYLHEIFSGAPGPGRSALSAAKIEHVTAAKKVTKRWGEERWLIAEGAPFGFKVINIRAGQKTSLQYHERKEEANLVLRGSGVFLYANASNEPLKQADLSAGDIIHILPGKVHRIHARTDVTLIEVSTPELDDVIRLQDDWNRGSGRIESEHSGEEVEQDGFQGGAI
ncbi:mannose-6-phosphate isomerase-like protein (cupin superfamily) [Rhizobium mesoamericanum]|uniref:cupin domain-containing protein n=1 Tax=Rhizobium mesoamericanum TaxID=1079800 RepID=UPI002784C13E|nr:cupin domain-containing protein [Rhizobium mesoamericanum]MDQ0561011.1 mannose-6-phosphate isomerase-like protein (cupin superfamily) [Rhizobium mesoamericanum]